MGYLFISDSLQRGYSVLTGGITSIIHTFQVNPKYPFRALGNDWKWFYPNIVDEKYKPSTIVMEGEYKYLEKRLLHLEGLQKYAQKIMNENKIERLKVDMQQLYLLHVNEKYKNCFLTSLRRALTWGLLLTAIALIILFVTIAVEQAKSPGQVDKAIQVDQIKPSVDKVKSQTDQIKFSPSPEKVGTEQIKPSSNKPVK